MIEFIRRLFDTDFMPHVLCPREPGLVMLHAWSDGLIALSYFLIPCALIVLIRRRRDLAFRPVYILFGAFILACGTTHVLAVVTLWKPVYWLEGLVKAITALASMGTAVVMVQLIPAALALPGPELARKRNAELEARVSERTLELEQARARLADYGEALDKAQTIIQKLDGTILFWNSGAEALYGWSQAEAVGRRSHELLRSELPCSLSEIQAALLEHGHWSGEFRQHCQDGTPIWVASHWILHRNAAGEPVSVVKVNNDITELKRATEALRASENTVRSLFENASQGILTAAEDGRLVDANTMAQSLFGYSHEELTGMSVDALLPGKLRDRHIAHRAAFALHPHTRPMGQGLDLVARRKNGSEFPVEISLSYVPPSDKAEIRGGLTMAFVSDITARKHASRLVETALAEKTVLLKEVHHRVKNNLAVIAGLLGLQADGLDDPRAKVALAESQQRVLSMALIHEYLYATEHLDRVNFGEYVHQLSHELGASYSIESDLVTVEVEAEDIDLPVHRAIPCGLILNELLSNALKYAFPDGRAGTIRVRFGRLESGGYSMVCSDDGIGIPEDFDWRNSSSLGLRIARILSKQIDATLTLDRSEGTRFELRLRDLKAAAV